MLLNGVNKNCEVPSILEPVGVDKGEGKRSDGSTAFSFSNGRSLFWDATGRDTYVETNHHVEPYQ